MVPRQPVIRSGILIAVRRYLTARGADYASLARRSGLKETDDDDPLRPLPLNAMLELFDRAAHELADPAFAIDFARALQPSESGLIGELILTAPTVRDALKYGAHHIEAFINPFEIDYLEEQGTGTIEWSYPETATASRVQFNVFLLSVLALRLQAAAGSNWSPLAVTMDHSAPTDNEVGVRAVLGSRVRFNGPRNRLTVDATTLARAMPAAHPVRFAMAQNLARRVAAESVRPDIVELTRSAIGGLLAAGQPDLSSVADRLGLSPGALQWRLERASTSFEKVVSDARRDRAERLLGDTDKSLTEIALDLGFSDLSAFSRAARRWFDMSPSAFRKHRRQPH